MAQLHTPKQLSAYHLSDTAKDKVVAHALFLALGDVAKADRANPRFADIYLAVEITKMAPGWEPFVHQGSIALDRRDLERYEWRECKWCGDNYCYDSAEDNSPSYCCVRCKNAHIQFEKKRQHECGWCGNNFVPKREEVRCCSISCGKHYSNWLKLRNG